MRSRTIAIRFESAAVLRFKPDKQRRENASSRWRLCLRIGVLRLRTSFVLLRSYSARDDKCKD